MIIPFFHAKIHLSLSFEENLMKKVSWKDIGLVNTRRMFKKAMEGSMPSPRTNSTHEQLQAIVMGCVESKSPFILQVSSGARKCEPDPFAVLAMGAVAMIKDAKVTGQIALHLDHGDTFELAKSCIDSGFLIGHDRRLAPLLRGQH